MSAVDMTGQLRGWVEKAISDICMGENFGYDVRWDLQNQMLVYTVVVTMPNPLLGQGPLINRFTAPVGALREDAIRLGVHNVMGQLREFHRKQLDKPPKVKSRTEAYN
jgi:hypothetical protein